MVPAVVAALTIGLSSGPVLAVPSDEEIAAAEAAAEAAGARVRDLAGALADAQAAVADAHASSVLALDEYQAKQGEFEQAQARAEAAAATAAQLTVELGAAIDDVVAFARRSYMTGSSYPGAASLITSRDVAQLVERAALLEAAGAHRSTVLDRVTVLQAQAAEADALARTALAAAEVLREQAAAALAVAQAAELSARSQASALAARRAAVEAELAQAQQALVALVGERAAADVAARSTAAARPAPAPAASPAPVLVGERAGAGSVSATATAIAAAQAYLGTTYAWGGGGSFGPGWGIPPDDGVFGFDCSGLTQYAYAQAGIVIPRNSRAQYRASPKVEADDLQAGDLVFWATEPADPDTIHHVGLYLGDGRVLHAPQSGDVVKVSAMWWRSYAGAVRPSA